MNTDASLQEVMNEAISLGQDLFNTHAAPLAQLIGAERATSRTGLARHAEIAHQQTGITEFDDAALALDCLATAPVRQYPTDLRRTHRYLADGLQIAAGLATRIDQPDGAR